MKTNEFIKQVEELGFCAREFTEVIHLRKYAATSLAAHISKTKEFIFDITYEEYRDLDVETRGKFLDLIVEYSKTPIEEREEPKKYHLRLKQIEFFMAPHLLFLNKYKEKFIISDTKPTALLQTVFTQEEIDEMPLRLIGLFDKIEVKDEE